MHWMTARTLTVEGIWLGRSVQVLAGDYPSQHVLEEIRDDFSEGLKAGPTTGSEMTKKIVKLAAQGSGAFAWRAVARAIGNVRNQLAELVTPVEV